MKEALIAKLQGGRPVAFTPGEASHLREALRQAMAVALEIKPEQIADGTRVFDDLGLDSVDVFDVLDQLGETFEAGVELEELPAEMIYGREGLTFLEFAQGILDFFAAAPPAQEE